MQPLLASEAEGFCRQGTPPWAVAVGCASSLLPSGMYPVGPLGGGDSVQPCWEESLTWMYVVFIFQSCHRAVRKEDSVSSAQVQMPRDNGDQVAAVLTKHAALI